MNLVVLMGKVLVRSLDNGKELLERNYTYPCYL